MDTPLVVTNFKDWLAEHYKDGSAFTVKGTGKQQYLCAIDDDQAIFLLEQALRLQNPEMTQSTLKDALSHIIDDKESEYDQIDKNAIDNLVEDFVEKNQNGLELNRSRL